MIACRYGNFFASASEMGNDSVAPDIPASNFPWTRGIVMMCSKVARTAVAVVSEPAILDSDAFREHDWKDNIVIR